MKGHVPINERLESVNEGIGQELVEEKVFVSKSCTELK